MLRGQGLAGLFRFRPDTRQDDGDDDEEDDCEDDCDGDNDEDEENVSASVHVCLFVFVGVCVLHTAKPRQYYIETRACFFKAFVDYAPFNVVMLRASWKISLSAPSVLQHWGGRRKQSRIIKNGNISI